MLCYAQAPPRAHRSRFTLYLLIYMDLLHLPQSILRNSQINTGVVRSSVQSSEGQRQMASPLQFCWFYQNSSLHQVHALLHPQSPRSQTEWCRCCEVLLCFLRSLQSPSPPAAITNISTHVLNIVAGKVIYLSGWVFIHVHPQEGGRVHQVLLCH